MNAPKILSSFLVCTALQASAQVGDNDCVIQYYLGKVGTDGVYTLLMDCVTWPINEATVQLAPGEQVRIQRFCPGCTYCPNAQVGLERRVGSGPGHASFGDPVLDTLPLSTTVGTDFAEPGSYYLRGIAPYYGLPYFAASLRLIVHSTTTAVDEPVGMSFRAWALPGAVALEHSPAGVLSLLDMTGKSIHSSRIPANNGIQAIALPELPTGSYIILLASDEAMLRRRIMID